MNLLDRIRADVNGARILDDWLGDGGEPVGHTQACYRRAICLDCPKKTIGHKFEEESAKAIMEQIGIAAQLDIVANDPNKTTCSVCNCYLPLKVWVPWKHLKNFTDPAKFPQNCWIPKEAANDNSTQSDRPPP